MVTVTAFRGFSHREEHIKQSKDVYSVFEQGLVIMSVDKNKSVLVNERTNKIFEQKTEKFNEKEKFPTFEI